MQVRFTCNLAVRCPGSPSASMPTLTLALCSPKVRDSRTPFSDVMPTCHVVILMSFDILSKSSPSLSMLSSGKMIVALASTRARSGSLQIVSTIMFCGTGAANHSVTGRISDSISHAYPSNRSLRKPRDSRYLHGLWNGGFPNLRTQSRRSAFHPFPDVRLRVGPDAQGLAGAAERGAELGGLGSCFRGSTGRWMLTFRQDHGG